MWIIHIHTYLKFIWVPTLWSRITDSLQRQRSAELEPWIRNFHKSNLDLSFSSSQSFCHHALLHTVLHSGGSMSALLLPVFCTEVKWWFWFSPTVATLSKTRNILSFSIPFHFYSSFTVSAHGIALITSVVINVLFMSTTCRSCMH